MVCYNLAKCEISDLDSGEALFILNGLKSDGIYVHYPSYNHHKRTLNFSVPKPLYSDVEEILSEAGVL